MYEQHRLRLPINVAMHKIKPGTLTAETVNSNFKGTAEKFFARDNAISFMNSVRRIPTYCKHFLYDVLAMQLGIRTYFLTLSCADLRREEIMYIFDKLNNLGLSDEELKHLSYQERCNLLNNNPVRVARHFQYKIEVFC